MLTVIRDLQQNDNKLWLEINKRLTQAPDSIGWWCRYTYGELRAMGVFCDTYYMSLDVDVNAILNKRFNALEQSVIKQIMGTTNSIKLDNITKQVKVYTQKSKRALERMILDIEFEREQLAEKAAHESKMFKGNEDSAVQAYSKLKEIF